MLLDYHNETMEMVYKAGRTNIRASDTKQNPELDIHEMGGVRMGKDSKT